ncbi:DUF5674 family protein [Coleofasciculus sp. LEGE 07081]
MCDRFIRAHCETILLDEGSEETNIWGADWYP